MDPLIRSVLYLLATIAAAVGAQIALVPSWHEATSPHFIGALLVTAGGAVAGWLIKSPMGQQ